MQVDTILAHGTVVTMDDAFTLIEDGAVAIRGDFEEGFRIYGEHGSVHGHVYLPWFHKSSIVECFSTKDRTYRRPLGEDAYSIRSRTMSDETKGVIVSEMETLSGSTVTVQNFTSVSPSVGAEVTRAAGLAILMAAAVILLYIWYAFRGVEHSFRYGTAAVIAMSHRLTQGRSTSC